MSGEPNSATEQERLSRSTLAVRGGRTELAPGEPLTPPVVLSSSFRAGGEHGYARSGNPTWEALEDAIGALEGGTPVAFSSGMAAISAVLDGLAPGAPVAVADSAYAESRRLLTELEASGAIRLRAFDPDDLASAEGAARGADMLWLDALSNPMLDVPALDDLAAIGREQGVRVVVDSTLATPMLVRPLELGADLVVHSATKHMGGHSDLLLGVAVAREGEDALRLRDSRVTRGAAPGTMDAWLALRGLRTLSLRVEREQATALALAERIAEHPGVTLVRYPGLEEDPAHRAASRLMDGYGSILSFEAEGGAERADALCGELRLVVHATSLGGVETLIDRHSRCNAESGAPDGLLRLSVGCEDPEDLWADLERGLALSA